MVPACLSDNLGFFLMELGVEDRMFNLFLLEEMTEDLGFFD